MLEVETSHEAVSRLLVAVVMICHHHHILHAIGIHVVTDLVAPTIAVFLVGLINVAMADRIRGPRSKGGVVVEVAATTGESPTPFS